jgi:hypothetical protein
MKAANAYRVLHQRSSRLPARIDPLRQDCVEVVEIATGEVVLFWDLAAREATRRVRALREDLVRLDDEAFLEHWNAVG